MQAINVNITNIFAITRKNINKIVYYNYNKKIFICKIISKLKKTIISQKTCYNLGNLYINN